MPNIEELNTILEELSQSARRRDMPRRVKLCQKALTMVTRETRPELWGILQNTLANSLAQNPLGERAENIEQAIFYYQQALEVTTRQAYPEDWAMTQNNLAAAYAERLRLREAVVKCKSTASASQLKSANSAAGELLR